MAGKLRLGVLGLVHDHIWGELERLQKMEDVELVGAADPHEPLLDRFRQRTGVHKTYREYAELLDREQPEAVLAYGTNRGTGDLVELAASHGLHVMCEKPMASDLAVADRMLVAARRAGVVLMVNWPTFRSAAIRHAHDLVRQGAIGRVWQLKWRGGHCGPRELGCDEYFCEWLYNPIENGGGAMADYLGYGASLARLFIGQPAQVMAVVGRLVKQDIPVEDNGVVVLQYGNASAVLECTWAEAVPNQPPHHLVLYGTEGTIVAGNGVLVHTRSEPAGRTIEPPALQPPRRHGLEYFVHCIRTGERPEGMCSPENSHDAQEVMEAARLSALTGRRVPLPLVSHLYPQALAAGKGG